MLKILVAVQFAMIVLMAIRLFRVTNETRQTRTWLCDYMRHSQPSLHEEVVCELGGR